MIIVATQVDWVRFQLTQTQLISMKLICQVQSTQLKVQSKPNLNLFFQTRIQLDIKTSYKVNIP